MNAKDLRPIFEEVLLDLPGFISLLFGEPLRHPATGGWGWSRTMPDLVRDLSDAIRSQALPFLEPIRSAEDFAEMAMNFWENPHAPNKTALSSPAPAI